MKKALTPLLLLTLSLLNCFGQTKTISGIVTDKISNEPLPFVNITYGNGRKGTVSNIDGKFELAIPDSSKFLTFSYVGYSPYIFNITPDSNKKLNIKLNPNPVKIAEVTIFPTENPAHRIIEKVIENRDKNNPEKMRSFSYTSYNKMYFTGIPDTLNNKSLSTKVDSLAKDSVSNKVNDVLSKQHLLLIEYVSQRNFKYPAKNYEKILSSRVSGLKDPMFVLLATQMQSFSFYNEFFTILNKSFLNPISKGSTSKYFFLIEDTMFTQESDTLFVISYRPRKGKNFDGLKGVLYINTNGYAIQNVLAEPVTDNEIFGIKIQQQYKLIDGKQWFPIQLNTDLLYKTIVINDGKKNVYLAAIGKSYLSDIKLDPKTDSVKFSHIELQVAPEASKQNDEFWNNHRAEPLSKKDSVTYQIIDSIGRKIKLDEKMKAIDLLMFGYLPWGKFNLDLNKIFGYNHYEGFRIGMGISTNTKMLKFASVGGFISYGFKDKKTKYSVFTELFPEWYSDTKLTLRYSDYVVESGKISFLDEYTFNTNEFIREFFIWDMNITKEQYASFSFRTLQNLKLNFYFNHSEKTYYNYSFNSNIILPNTTGYNLNFTEVGLQIKLAFGEKFMKTPRGMLLSLGTKYPIVWLNIIKGVHFAKGDFNYTKFEAKLSKTFTTKAFGKSQFMAKGAIADGDIPLSNLYSSQGTHSNFNLDIENSFNTIRPGEFYSSKFLAIFYRQNFGSLLFSTKKFKPEIAIVANAGWGVLKNKAMHEGIIFKSMERGYYETGLLFYRLINSTLWKIGIGAYYRLGDYSFQKTADNFTYKLTFGYNL